MKQYNNQPKISIIILLMVILITLIFFPTIIKFASVLLDLEKTAPQLASTMSNVQTISKIISSCIFAFISIIAIGAEGVELINTNDDDNNK